MRQLAILVSLAAAATTAMGVHAGELAPYEASYHFITQGINAGTVTTTLRRDDQGQWTAERVAQPRGFARLLTEPSHELSQLELTGGNVRPVRYVGSNGGPEHDVSLRFDWQRRRATGSIGSKPVDETLRPGMQDDL